MYTSSPKVIYPAESDSFVSTQAPKSAGCKSGWLGYIHQRPAPASLLSGGHYSPMGHSLYIDRHS
jgi:hypothetical protein